MKNLVEEYQKYHNPKEDQDHMNKHLILFNTSKYISVFHACICLELGDCIKCETFNKYKNKIKFIDFIEIITDFTKFHITPITELLKEYGNVILQ